MYRLCSARQLGDKLGGSVKGDDMARETNKLTVKEVEAILKAGRPGKYRDGGGLLLQIVGGSAVWVWRGTVKGKRSDLGLGSARLVSLKEARDKAHEMRKTARDGRDPTAERKATSMTFEDAAKQVHAQKLKEWSDGGKHQDQWINTLTTYAFPFIGKKLVSDIEPADVIEVLEPIWHSKQETARRLRQRIRFVFDWASAKGLRPQHLVNPAQPVTGALGEQTGTVRHYPAVPWLDAPKFLIKLRESPSVESTRWALELLLLTASRSKEVRLATWSEIDFEARCWTKPAEHMKGRKGKRVQHRVPLSDQAIALLREVRAHWPNSRIIFPGRDLRRPLSDMTMEKLMKKGLKWLDENGELCVPHGLRSTFRDWGTDSGHADDALERALAHIEPNKTKRSYKRSDMFEARVPLMQAWADFVSPRPKAVDEADEAALVAA
jgi:integrase